MGQVLAFPKLSQPIEVGALLEGPEMPYLSEVTVEEEKTP